MWKAGRAAGLVVAAVLLMSGVAAAQEGAVHKFFRGLMAIPKAIVGSFDGPGACVPGVQICQSGVAVPYTVITTQPYLAVAPTAVVQQEPEYVTYNALVTVNGAAQPAPNAYIYDPVPFNAP